MNEQIPQGEQGEKDPLLDGYVKGEDLAEAHVKKITNNGERKALFAKGTEKLTHIITTSKPEINN